MPAAWLIALLLLGPSGADIEWSSNERCPGAEHELTRVLDAYLGDASEGAGVEAELAIVEGEGAGLRLSLELESGFGREQHELYGPGCEQLVEQAAILVAGAIDPFVYAPGPGSSPTNMRIEVAPIQRPQARVQVAEVDRPPEREPEFEPEPEFELEREPEPIRRERLVSGSDPAVDRAPHQRGRRGGSEGSLSLGPLGFVGLFPQAGGGARIDGALERGAFRWQLGLSGYFGGRMRAAEDPHVGADAWALDGSSGLCGVFVLGQARKHPVRVPLCGVGGVGFVAVRSVGTIEPHSSVRPWARAGGEIGFMVLARADLAVGLDVGVHASLVRPTWELRAPDESFAVAPVIGMLRATLEIRGLGRDQNSPR